MTGPKSSKKDLLAKQKKELMAYIEQRLDVFRNAVNEATEGNMQRVGGWLNHSAYALDFQVDRVSALIELVTKKLEIAPEEFQAEVERQRAQRLAYIEQQKAAREAAKAEAEKAEAEKAEAVPEEAAAPPPTEEEVVLSASYDSISPGEPEGEHPSEAQIFGG
jgi:hypothetical protein